MTSLEVLKHSSSNLSMKLLRRCGTGLAYTVRYKLVPTCQEQAVFFTFGVIYLRVIGSSKRLPKMLKLRHKFTTKLSTYQL